MLTRNWYKILYGMLKGSSANTSQGYPYTNSGNFNSIGIIQFNGAVPPETSTYNSYIAYTAFLSPLAYKYEKQIYKQLINGQTNKFGIAIGSGTAQPTIDDFKMESLITSGITMLSASATTTSDSKGSKFVCTYTFQNTSENSITIGEIGYCIAPTDSQATVYDRTILMDRTLLETPVTIEAGGVGKVEYVMELINPFEVDS